MSEPMPERGELKEEQERAFRQWTERRNLHLSDLFSAKLRGEDDPRSLREALNCEWWRQRCLAMCKIIDESPYPADAMRSIEELRADASKAALDELSWAKEKIQSFDDQDRRRLVRSVRPMNTVLISGSVTAAREMLTRLIPTDEEVPEAAREMVSARMAQIVNLSYMTPETAGEEVPETQPSPACQADCPY